MGFCLCLCTVRRVVRFAASATTNATIVLAGGDIASTCGKLLFMGDVSSMGSMLAALVFAGKEGARH